MRIVVFGPNLVGDGVMATPALRALRARWPEARIDAVLRPAVAATLAGNPTIDGVIPFDPRGDDPARTARGVVARLREDRPDLAVLLPNSFRSAWMAWRGGSRRRAGYDRGGRRWLLTDRLKPPLDRRGRFAIVPTVAYYQALTDRLGCPRPGGTRLDLFTTHADENAADRALAALGFDGDGPLVTLNTGGAFGPAKCWPEGHFAALARRLAEERRARVLVLCGPSEREAARAIARAADHRRVVALADQADEAPGIGLSKALVRRSDLMVTTDSGPRHFATAFRVPVVSLFGPTHIGWTRTNHPHALNLRVPVPCGPCQQGTCAEGHHRCMVELSPEAVLAASTRLLSDRGRNAAAIEPAGSLLTRSAPTCPPGS